MRLNRWMVSSEGQEDTESRSIDQADFAQKKAADFLQGLLSWGW